MVERCVPFGSMAIIFFISSSKPTSNIRSASSMTKHFRLRKTNPFVFWYTEFNTDEELVNRLFISPRGDPEDDQVLRQSG